MWETPVRHRTALLAALLASTATVVSIACGPARASAAPKPQPLATELAADMARLGAVSWSASKPLEWNDFIGPAPSTGSEGALTVYSLFHGLRCTGRTFEFLVTAGFLPSRSWVKPNVLNDRDLRGRTLLHEQTHFDISEVHARRMRKYFAELYNPCGQSEEQLQASADGFVREEAAAQAQYDAETAHGRRLPEQRQWEERVVVWLRSLGTFQRGD